MTQSSRTDYQDALALPSAALLIGQLMDLQTTCDATDHARCSQSSIRLIGLRMCARCVWSVNFVWPAMPLTTQTGGAQGHGERRHAFI